MEIYDRLKEIRAYNNMSQSDFSSSLGIGQSTLGMMEVGKRNISDRHIKTICSIFDVDEHWLRTGEGEMHAKTEAEVVSQLKALYKMSDEQARLMDIFLAMDGEKRDQVAAAFFSLIDVANKQADIQLSADPAPVDPIQQELDAYKKELIAQQEAASVSAPGEDSTKNRA